MVANFLSSTIGSAISSMFGSGNSDSDSAYLSYYYSKKLQKHQYQLDRLVRQNSYGDTRKSLERAGYNPLLAVGQQSNGGTYGASLSVTDPKSENLQNDLAVANMNSQLKLNSAQAYNQFMQGNLTTAQANNLISQSRLNSAQTTLTNLQSNAQAIQNLHLPKLLKSQIYNNNNSAQAAMINASANQASAQAAMMNANTNSAVGQSQIWRNYNQSLGYNTTVHAGPVTISHTGNSIGRNNSGKNPTYQTEYINGKPVKVLVIN